jgi:arachidonate 15-lipoxygenase
VRDRSASDRIADRGPLPDSAAYLDLIRRPLVQPETCRRGLEDDVFAWQRVAGLNPLVIRGVRRLPAGVSLDEARLRGVWREGLDLATELADGNIFVTDYTVVDGIGTSTDDAGTRQVWPLIGIFHVDRKANPDANLMPLAIQLGTKGRPNQLCTPSEGPRWTIAKTALQCADLTLHELDAHLGRSHLGLEGIVVACHRTLSRRHPLMALLRPHFRMVAFSNLEARMQRVGPGQKLDRLMAGGVHNGISFLRRVRAATAADGDAKTPSRTLDLAEFSLLADLAERGVDGIPTYPYAEDAANVWGVIHAFCREYVAVYYGHDDDVSADEEVQALVWELASHEGARLHGVRPIESRAALVDLMTHFIFASGPQHSAVNYAQYECAASAANMPLALYRALPDDLRSFTDDEARAFLLEMLPPVEKANAQLRIMVELTSFQFDRLGHYLPDDFTDPLVQAAIARFQERLAAVDHIVDARNTARLVPYPFLKPSNILNAASI